MMVIKTFNIDEDVYKQFSTHCKKNGVSMSKRVENFIRDEVAKINAFVKMNNEKKIVSEKVKPIVNKAEVAEGNGHSVKHTFSKYC